MDSAAFDPHCQTVAAGCGDRSLLNGVFGGLGGLFGGRLEQQDKGSVHVWRPSSDGGLDMLVVGMVF